MKLKIFRIISIILTSILVLGCIFLAIFNIFQAEIREDDSYLLYLICFFVGGLFLVFEIVFIAKAFKEGTLLLHGLCLKEKTFRKKPATLIVASVIGVLSIGYLVFNILAYTHVITIKQSPMALEFNMSFASILLLNALEVVIYWLFIVQEDIGVKD